MTRAVPRLNFSSSQLVRALAGLADTEVARPQQSIAERLAPWLGVADAITVFAALGAGPAKASGGPAGARSPACAALQEEIACGRSALADSIAAGQQPGGGRQAGRKLPRPEPGAAIEAAADFAPYHRYYLTQQRDLAAGVGQLRDKARAALAGAAPRLRQLADLDAAIDRAWSERERELFAVVPTLLEKRFNALRDGHRQALGDAPDADDPQAWTKPGGWLARFGNEMQAVLLAELDVRLQPVLGLAEACRNEETKHQ